MIRKLQDSNRRFIQTRNQDLEGENRHEAILRVMDSLLSRNKGILTLEQIKKLSLKEIKDFVSHP